MKFLRFASLSFLEVARWCREYLYSWRAAVFLALTILTMYCLTRVAVVVFLSVLLLIVRLITVMAYRSVSNYHLIQQTTLLAELDLEAD